MIPHVAPGQPFNRSASTFNSFVDVANWYARRRPQQSEFPDANYGDNTEWVQNWTGTTQERFAILKFETTAIDPDGHPADSALLEFQNSSMCVGALPAYSPVAPFCVLLEACPDNAYRPAQYLGLATVKIDVKDTSHLYARMVAGETGYLQSSLAGNCRIIEKQTGTGLKWAKVLLNQVNRKVKAVVTESGGITSGGSGEVTFYSGTSADSETQTAYLNWAEGGESISQNKECFVEWFEDEEKWVITGAECE